MHNSIFLHRHVILGSIQTWLQPDEAGCSVKSSVTRARSFLRKSWCYSDILTRASPNSSWLSLENASFFSVLLMKIALIHLIFFPQQVCCYQKRISTLHANFSLLSPWIFFTRCCCRDSVSLQILCSFNWEQRFSAFFSPNISVNVSIFQEKETCMTTSIILLHQNGC